MQPDIISMLVASDCPTGAYVIVRVDAHDCLNKAKAMYDIMGHLPGAAVWLWLPGTLSGDWRYNRKDAQ